MIIRYPKTADPAGPREEEKAAAAGKEADCRCKEASEMTPRQLIRLMLSDLAFWKKTKKE